MPNKEEKEIIEQFLHWLDQSGYNYWIIETIRNLLLKGEK